MFSLVYRSHASRPLSAIDLLDLLRQSRSNNERVGVTGLLLYTRGAFLQQLDGEEETVRSIFARIETDDRHRDVEILAADAVGQADYPEWSMGFSFPEPDELARVVAGYDPEAISPDADRALVDKPMARLLVAMQGGEEPAAA